MGSFHGTPETMRAFIYSLFGQVRRGLDCEAYVAISGPLARVPLSLPPIDMKPTKPALGLSVPDSRISREYARVFWRLRS
nr:hypothetical protein Itr_chr04CG02570 [Ipomoea trifida]